MSDAIVVDASLSLKWVLDETYTPEAVALLADWVQRKVPLLAPPLLAYEATNVLWQRVRRGELVAGEAQDALGSLLLILAPCLRYLPNLELRAFAHVTRFNLPAAYDAQYLAMADHAGAEFWTADERLWNAVRTGLSWVHWVGEIRATAC